MRKLLLSALILQLLVPISFLTPAYAQINESNELGSEYMVICTADGLKVVRIEDGAEIPQEKTQSEHCFSCRLSVINFTLPEANALFSGFITYEAQEEALYFDDWAIPQGTVVRTHSARAPPRTA